MTGNLTYQEAVEHLHGLAMFGARFGLEPTRRLAAAAGNPHHQLRFIHVAGTNGKGSTCAMLESIYRAAGLRVGLFTSPHLVSFRERLQVDRRLISEADVTRLVQEVLGIQLAARGEAGSHGSASQTAVTSEAPTFFEFVTVMALKYFAEQRCDLVIWETGLGGRLDATNIVTPLACVITSIALDHQQWLGTTLEQIAAEKAGIIKPGVPVLTAAMPPEVTAVIRNEAERNRAPFKPVDLQHPQTMRQVPLKLPLPGMHQRANAALALAVVAVLQDQLPVSAAAIQRGLESVCWAGRGQVVRIADREFLLDGAHNLDGVRALTSVLKGVFGNGPIGLMLGMLADKDWEPMCQELAPLAGRIATVRVDSARSLEPSVLASACQRSNPTAHVTAHVNAAEALEALLAERRVVVAGSLYLIGEVMEGLGLATAPAERELNEWQPERLRNGN